MFSSFEKSIDRTFGRMGCWCESMQPDSTHVISTSQKVILMQCVWSRDCASRGNPQSLIATLPARVLGHEDRVTYVEGDFLLFADRIDPADITILGEVVQCSHDPERLVREWAVHTRDIFAITFPRNHWKIRWIIWLVGPFRGGFFCSGSASRPETVRTWLRDEGFERSTCEQSGMWHSEVYVRRTGSRTSSEARSLEA